MNLRELIKRHEGLRLKLYRCPAGKLSIGYGRNLEDRGISNDEADYLLENDISHSIKEAAGVLPSFHSLSDARQAVVVSMIFNMGLPGFLKFKKTLAAITTEQWNTAADEMLDSHWAIQVGRRGRVLAEMMRTGEFPGEEHE